MLSQKHRQHSTGSVLGQRIPHFMDSVLTIVFVRKNSTTAVAGTPQSCSCYIHVHPFDFCMKICLRIFKTVYKDIFRKCELVSSFHSLEPDKKVATVKTKHKGQEQGWAIVFYKGQDSQANPSLPQLLSSAAVTRDKT